METIIIHESDFDINNQNSIDVFNLKLRKIKEPFNVSFDYPIPKIPSFLFSSTKLSNIEIPSSVTEIEPWAFEYCAFIKIILPSSITKIGDHAFHNCIFLRDITIPNSINCLSSNIFGHCYCLARVTIQQPKDYFLLYVEGAQSLYNNYKDIISFENLKSIDELLLENNSIEQIITNLELEF